MEIINPDGRDYHMHSLNYSDGLNTIDELVIFAGRFGLEEIAITDHSDAALKASGLAMKTYRGIVQKEGRWQNIHNDVRVIFGVEGDILNENGDICDTIQGKEGDFLVLSLHKEVYQGDFSRVTEAYCRALEHFAAKIKVLGHPCIKAPYQQHLDIVAVTELANQLGVAMEFNCANLVNEKTDKKQEDKMLTRAERVYVNSDAHTLHELKTARAEGFAFLREYWYQR
ncbi:PHP domain-containing protein [Candidatus Woesearchaeota archaeon]|nr:PHP domain-containing protein [Candidatus Woesearchaeota archaeon]